MKFGLLILLAVIVWVYWMSWHWLRNIKDKHNKKD